VGEVAELKAQISSLSTGVEAAQAAADSLAATANKYQAELSISHRLRQAVHTYLDAVPGTEYNAVKAAGARKERHDPAVVGALQRKVARMQRKYGPDWEEEIRAMLGSVTEMREELEVQEVARALLQARCEAAAYDNEQLQEQLAASVACAAELQAQIDQSAADVLAKLDAGAAEDEELEVPAAKRFQVGPTSAIAEGAATTAAPPKRGRPPKTGGRGRGKRLLGQPPNTNQDLE
jgi:FtsZ-binding cell division protein ZapB